MQSQHGHTEGGVSKCRDSNATATEIQMSCSKWRQIRFQGRRHFFCSTWSWASCGTTTADLKAIVTTNEDSGSHRGIRARITRELDWRLKLLTSLSIPCLINFTNPSDAVEEERQSSVYEMLKLWIEDLTLAIYLIGEEVANATIIG